MKLTKDQFIIAVINGDVTKQVLHGTHILDTHVSTSIVSDINQIISGKKTLSSHYTTQTDYTEIMESTLIDASKQIMNWLNDPHAKPKRTFTSNPGKEDPITGQGVRLENGRIRPYQTKISAVILEKNNSNPYGFIVKTMYPDIDHPNAIPWDKDLTGMLKLTHTYRNASPEQRLHLEQMVRPGGRPEKARTIPVNQQIRAASADDRHAGAARRVMEKAEKILNKDRSSHDLDHPGL